MIWINIKRVIKAGFINFTRNTFVSLAAVLIMTVTLFVIGSVMFMVAGLNSSLNEIRNKVDISVYFKINALDDAILATKKSIEALPGVSEVEYVSKQMALDNFKKRHEGDSLTLQALEELGENPLGAVLNIRAKDPSQYESIANYLKEDNALSQGEQNIIDRINYFDNKVAIERLAKVISAAEQFGLAISIILIIISLIICFNTIRLAIFISRDEISVMKLVGASNKYIRGPFVISGVIYGLMAGILTLIIFYPLTRWLGVSSANFFGGLNFFIYYTSNFGEFFGMIAGSGIVLGALSSYFAVRRYLKI